MKKIFAIIVALAVTAALAISAFAGIDALYADVNSYQQNPGMASDTTVKINPGQKLYILGWFASPGKSCEKVVWFLDGAEKECSDNYRDRTEIATLEAFQKQGFVADDFIKAGFGHDTVDQGGLMELLGVDTLPEGTYTVSIKGKYTDGSYENLKADFTLQVGEGAPATDKDYIIVPQSNLTDGIWLQTNGQWVGVEFTTTAPFSRVSVPSTWSSRKDANRECNVVLKLYKFEYNAEYTLSKDPVKSFTYEIESDGVPVCMFDLGESVAAGTYIFTITVEGEKLTGDFSNNDNAYFVLDHAPDGTDTSIVKYLNTEKTFCLTVKGDIVEGEFVVANPADTDAPQQGGDDPVTPPPATGDASLVIFVIAAVAVALVVLKKRAF